MKQLLVLLLCLAAFRTQATPLSRDARISVLTCSPGAELYSLFGHTAIRVEDPATDTDLVFNYGTFDFNTPHFYLKYARGLLPYQLSVTTYPHFLYVYRMDGRSVYSQSLLLDSIEKQRLFDLLAENYRPENRTYLYNFLFDNCTTRVRDLILHSTDTTIAWTTPAGEKNFWNLLDEYLEASPWVQWGIHTILGQRGNRKATILEHMFLPDYFMYALDAAQVDNRRLAGETKTLYRAPEQEPHTPWYRHPLFVFAAGCALLTLLLLRFRNRRLLNAVAFLFFLFTGIVGCLIVFLGAFTAHPITAPNWNILWANPLNLAVLPFLFTARFPALICRYLKLYAALLTVAIPVWAIAQPAVPMASVFLIFFLIFLTLRLRRTKRA